MSSNLDGTLSLALRRRYIPVVILGTECDMYGLILLVVTVCGLKSGNVCCRSVQNLLSSTLLPKKIKD